MKTFKTVADAKALKRQRLIAAHYADIALNREQLEKEAAEVQKLKQDYEY